MNRLLLLQGLTGKKAFKFDPATATFTPSVAKRNSAGPFAAGVLVQGNMSVTGTPDILSINSSLQIVDKWYKNIDPYQGSIVFWITPEWNGNDGLNHEILGDQNTTRLLKTNIGKLYLYIAGISFNTVDVSSWVAGTTYQVVCRWDCKSTLDGTNYFCVSINDVHSFGITAIPIPVAISSAIVLGSYSIGYAANALIEGLTIYRRPLFDGSYGTDVGNGDELAQIYNGGAGKDPTEITGSWDVCFCLPTNATPGALVTGTGEAWSHPHSSNLVKDGWMSEGYYGGGDSAVQFNGIDSRINCGSDIALDNLANADMTVESWCKYGSNTLIPILAQKGTSFIEGWSFGSNGSDFGTNISCATTSPTAVIDKAYLLDNKWHHWAFTWSNLGDRKIRLYYDGQLVATSGIGVGAIIPDASSNLLLGNGFGLNRSSSTGSLGWSRISNSIRYTSNFIPSRLPPTVDANTVGQWNMAEGSGTVVDNAQGVATRDGVITNGTWANVWNDVGTPKSVRSVAGTGTSGQSAVDCGNHASINGLLAGSITAEMWACVDKTSTGYYELLGKGAVVNLGWGCWVSNTNNNLSARVCNTIFGSVNTTALNFADKRWHHVAMTFSNVGDRKLRLFVDGVLIETSIALTGTISPDIELFRLGVAHSGSNSNLKNLGWARISNSIRYTTNFTPPSRANPPLNDANTVRLFKLDEGAGNTIIDYSTNAQNATLSNGTWNNTRDMASGEKVYAWGTEFGSDGANEGVGQIITGASLIQNGNFASETGWQKNAGWVISGGKATHTPGTAESLLQPILTIGRTYIVTFTMSGRTSGNVNIFCGSGNSLAHATNSVFSRTMTCIGSTNIDFYAGATFDGSIDDVSVWDIAYPYPEQNFVLKPVIHYDKQATPKLRVLDATNGNAEITSIMLPDQKTNLVVNGGFDVDTSGWISQATGSIASVANGFSGNCLLITCGSTAGYARQSIQLIPYASYKVTYKHKNGSATGLFNVGLNIGTSEFVNSGTMVDAVWVERTLVFTTQSTGLVWITMFVSNSVPGDTTFYDDISITRVIDSKRPWSEHISFEAPTIARNGVAADCTKIAVQVINTASEGVVSVHQVELLNNLIDNPSFETGSGDPWIPSGWTQALITSGVSSQDSIIYHSGNNSIKLQTSTLGSAVYHTGPIAQGVYYSRGGFSKVVSGSVGDWVSPSVVNQALNTSNHQYVINSNNVWSPSRRIHRAIANDIVEMQVRPTAVGSIINADDFYMFSLDPITLTVTPASLANSMENGGIRVDGKDMLLQTIPPGKLTSTKGSVKFRVTPRHNPVDVAKFGVGQPDIALLWENSSNYLVLMFSDPSTLMVHCVANGVIQTKSVNVATLLLSGITYLVELGYGYNYAFVKIDGVFVAKTDPSTLRFSALPTRIYFGSNGTPDVHYDAVFSAP